MCKFCSSLYEVILYMLCCYKGEENDYDIETICNIDWSAYQFDDDLYGAIKINKEITDK